MYGEFACRGAEGVVNFECILEEICSSWGNITGDGWPCGARANLVNACIRIFSSPPAAWETAYLENRLHLRELREWVLAREHLDDETAKTPNICLACVRGLLDNLGGHPEYGALQSWTMILGQGYTYQHIVDEHPRKVSKTSTHCLRPSSRRQNRKA